MVDTTAKGHETQSNQNPVSYTHLRAHETGRHLVCRLLLEKKKATKHIEKLKGRIIVEKEKLMPELENAIENLAQ